MRLKVVATNFLANPDWVFKLLSETNQEYYMMHDAFYKEHALSSPVSKKELDTLDKGHWVNAATECVNDVNVVTHLY